MPVDELVFTREQLKRDLNHAVLSLEDADKKYDPSDPTPREDLAMGLVLRSIYGTSVKDYIIAIAHHVSANSDPNTVTPEAREALDRMIQAAKEQR
jgi:hypothetical protein